METVKIEAYNEQWPMIYQEEKSKVERIMADKTIAIEHIGSTAIPGLGAKAVIDFMVGVRDLLEVEPFIDPLARIGYEHVYHEAFPNRRFFRRGPWRAGTHHLHVYVYGSDEWNNQLAFRDYLIEHPEKLKEYDKLKKELSLKYPHDRAAYTSAKHPFINEIIQRARL